MLHHKIDRESKSLFSRVLDISSLANKYDSTLVVCLASSHSLNPIDKNYNVSVTLGRHRSSISVTLAHIVSRVHAPTDQKCRPETRVVQVCVSGL